MVFGTPCYQLGEYECLKSLRDLIGIETPSESILKTWLNKRAVCGPHETARNGNGIPGAGAYQHLFTRAAAPHNIICIR